MNQDRGRAPVGQRLRDAFLKPPDPSKAQGAPARRSVEELEAAAKSADDKERLVGLIGAPFAAAISMLVISALIDNDPPATLHHHVNRAHVSVSLYHDLLLVLLALSIAMLALAWFRKRLFLGMVMALFGLAVFNLRYWGFGIPYILAGAWLLVRAYRTQRDLREATGGSGASTSPSGRPSASRRYTPPRARSRSGA